MKDDILDLLSNVERFTTHISNLNLNSNNEDDDSLICLCKEIDGTYIYKEIYRVT